MRRINHRLYQLCMFRPSSSTWLTNFLHRLIPRSQPAIYIQPRMMSCSNLPVDSTRNMVFSDDDISNDFMYLTKQKKVYCWLWIMHGTVPTWIATGKNWTNQCGLKMQFFLLQDQPSCWFSQDYGFLGWWSDQLLCRCKCLTTHEDMIPSNKTMLRGEYVHFVPFWWGSNSLRLLDIFVFKIEIFKVWTYVFSLHIGTRNMQKKLLPNNACVFSFSFEYGQNIWQFAY